MRCRVAVALSITLLASAAAAAGRSSAARGGAGTASAPANAAPVAPAKGPEAAPPPAPAAATAPAPQATAQPAPAPEPAPVPAGAKGTAPAVKGRVAVLDFVAAGVDATLAQTFTRLVAAELGRAGGLEAVGRDDLAAVVGLERWKQLTGCTGGACVSDLGALGGLVDARYVASGTVGRAGGLLLVTAQLIDTAKARVLNRALRRCSSPEQLTAEAAPLARELLAEPALLQLYGQVPGVAVLVDDRQVGLMPLGPLPVAAGGRHRLRLESADHLAWETSVELEPGRTTRVRAQLHRIEDVESRARARKWWAAGVLLAGAAAGAGAGLAWTDAAALRDRYQSADLLATSQADLDALAASSRLRYGVAYGLGGVSLSAAALGAWMLLTNPHADRLAEAR